MKSDWFKDWFNTKEYLNVYQHRNENDAESHINLILNNIQITNNADVLDMACGAGRHSILLARKNYRVAAVDLSENLLSIAKEQAKKEKLIINFINSDIRDFGSSQKFNLIINLFTSFGYFETDEENYSVLRKAYNLLIKDGFFVLDYFNSEFLTNNLIEFSKDDLADGEIIQERKILNKRVIKKITVNKNGSHEEFEESVRMYTKDELTNELTKIGFDIYKTFGDFLGNKFEQFTSPRLIFICKK